MTAFSSNSSKGVIRLRDDDPGLARGSYSIPALPALPSKGMSARGGPVLAIRSCLTVRSGPILTVGTTATANRLTVDRDNLPVLDYDGMSPDGDHLVSVARGVRIIAILADGVLAVRVSTDRDAAVLSNGILAVLTILPILTVLGILTVLTVLTDGITADCDAVLAVCTIFAVSALDDVTGTISRKATGEPRPGDWVLKGILSEHFRRERQMIGMLTGRGSLTLERTASTSEARGAGLAMIWKGAESASATMSRPAANMI